MDQHANTYVEAETWAPTLEFRMFHPKFEECISVGFSSGGEPKTILTDSNVSILQQRWVCLEQRDKTRWQDVPHVFETDAEYKARAKEVL